MAESHSITPLRVFLAYSSEQVSIAEQVYFSLKSAGHDVFFDRTNLPPGEEYNRAILDRIRSSDLFVFLISPPSIQESAYTRTELRFARDTWPNPEGRILPVLAVPTDFSQIPNYLKAVTILRPEGNLPAEVSARVNDLATGRTPQDTIAGRAELIDKLAEETEHLRRLARIAEIDQQWNIRRMVLQSEINLKDYQIDESRFGCITPAAALAGILSLFFIKEASLASLTASLGVIFISTIFFFVNLNEQAKKRAKAYEEEERRYHSRRKEALLGKHDESPVFPKESGTIGMKEARIIQQRRAAGESRKALAKEYQIKVSTVRYIEEHLIDKDM